MSFLNKDFLTPGTKALKINLRLALVLVFSGHLSDSLFILGDLPSVVSAALGNPLFRVHHFLLYPHPPQ